MSEFIKLLEDLHRESFGDHGWCATDFDELKKSGAEILASDNGLIVWRSVLDEAELLTIAVRPNSRRSGIAETMLALMEKELKSAGVKSIFLEVSVENIAAISLYKKTGFVEIGRRPGYYSGVDAINMKKVISD